MKVVREFLKEAEDFIFGVINEEGRIYSKEEVEEVLSALDVKEVVDTYFESIIFKADNEEIYELAYL